MNGESLPVGGVPTFGCVVYVAARDGGGGVRARVANLSGLECEGDGERAALAKLIPAFKQRISELLAKGAPIPWIEPVPEPAAGEQRRFVPVHL
jgi:hypothetical protein